MNHIPVQKNDLLTTIDKVAAAFSRLKGIQEGLASGGADGKIQFDEWDWEVGVGLYGFLRRALAANDRSGDGKLNADEVFGLLARLCVVRWGRLVAALTVR